ncbi:MAG TPA: HAD-IA family hydrolase [Candidatus Saccharimonadales bacterium]|nr:HAD-IA family hydrolase [Candidatus Saccharimonadales bacterium]
MDEKGLGQRLQEARKVAGLTQQVLCHRANISYSTLAKIERGAIKSPSIFTIQNIALALGVSLDALMGMESPAQLAKAAKKGVSKSGIRFVYFDINGCLVYFFHRAFMRLAEDTGVTPDVIESTFWLYNDDVCRGQLSMDDFNKLLAKRLGIPSVKWENYYLDAVEPIVGMSELVHWAAENYHVGLLTNIMPGMVTALRDRGLLPDVAYDVIVDSSEVGVIKPEPKIYEIAIERAGVKPEEILFVDDTRQNLTAADKLGWHVMWCDDYHPDETIARIRQSLEPAE